MISVFVVVWNLFFLYQTFRVKYLDPFCRATFGIALPRVPLLFPPAGWIMFYHVDASYGFAEVYGLKEARPLLIDPHQVFATRAVGYDNIHRNVLVGVLSREDAPAFCRYLSRKFPEYEGFLVVYGQYEDVVMMPDQVRRQIAYRCP